MERRQVRPPQGFRDQEVQIVDVKMNDVEASAFREQLLEHHSVVGERTSKLGFESKRASAARPELRTRLRITGRKQNDLMPERDELFRQIVNDTLCSAVRLARDAFVQGSHLGNLHVALSTGGEEQGVNARSSKTNAIRFSPSATEATRASRV